MNESTVANRGQRWQWLDWAAPFLAMAGLAASLVDDYAHVRVWSFPAVDFKVLFGAARLQWLGQDPYAQTAMQQLFRQDGVVAPESWMGHAPVYPPCTLALFSPLAWLDLGNASRVWFVLSTFLMALALGSMLSVARRRFEAAPWVRVLLLAGCVASPFLGFGLEIANVSVVVSALCLLTVFLEDTLWLRACCLAMALLLKPHIALWIWLAMVVFVGRWRRIAIRAAMLAVAFVSFDTLRLAMQGRLWIWTSYQALISSEVAHGGSMNAHTREVLPAGAQITSLWSLAGFWNQPVARNLAEGVMVLLALGMAWAVWRLRHAADVATQTLVAGAFVAYGMVVSYHRAHDALALYVLAPWLATRKGKQRWCSGLLLCVMCFGWFVLPAPTLLFYREASLSAVAVVCLLVLSLLEKSKKKPV